MDKYASRVYDEDLVYIDELGGNYFGCLTSELGFERICEKLQVDVKVGLSGSDFTERKERFGDNFRPEAVAKSWISLFFGALEDFMLRALIVCAIFSIVFEMILATPDHRKEGKN